MKVLIIGAAGMVGRKLLERLVADGRLGDEEIGSITAYDVVPASVPDEASMPVEVMTGDFPAEGEAERLIADRPDVIFHLAAIVSGEAEQDFEKGYRINLDGSMRLLEAIRLASGYRPRLVFASSIAVFGAPFPATIPDDYHNTPLTSYGTQKAITELLLRDYVRKGFLDGIGLRLPTIVVRPGKPNKAASGFFSNILREPLAGKEAVLPVSDQVRHWMASPRAAVGFFVHAATMDLPDGVNGRSYTMPGLSVTVAQMIAALERVAGKGTVARIRREPDPFVDKIVAGWAQGFDAKAATELGFAAESRIDDLIEIHIEDELGGKPVA